MFRIASGMDMLEMMMLLQTLTNNVSADNQEVVAVVNVQNSKRDGHVRNDDVITNSNKQRV
jgi:hypothetical protein